MKYATAMGSGVMTYIPSVITFGLGIHKLMGWVHRQHGVSKSLLLSFQNKENGLKERNEDQIKKLKYSHIIKKKYCE
jgi:hypothetical protein